MKTTYKFISDFIKNKIKERNTKWKTKTIANS